MIETILVSLLAVIAASFFGKSKAKKETKQEEAQRKVIATEKVKEVREHVESLNDDSITSEFDRLHNKNRNNR